MTDRFKMMAVAAVATLGAACGGAGSAPGAPSPTPAPPAAAPAPPPAPADPVTYTIRISTVATSQAQGVQVSPARQRRRLRVEGTITAVPARSITHQCEVRFPNLPEVDPVHLTGFSFTANVQPGTPLEFDRTADFTTPFPLSGDAMGQAHCGVSFLDGAGLRQDILRELAFLGTQAPATAGTCVPSSEVACLKEGRFAVQVRFQSPAGQAGPAIVMPSQTNADQAAFHFFNPDSVETLIRVLDGCAGNNAFWVFRSGPTPWEHAITVTDLRHGVERQFEVAAGPPAPFEDRTAFATCP